MQLSGSPLELGLLRQWEILSRAGGEASQALAEGWATTEWVGVWIFVHASSFFSFLSFFPLWVEIGFCYNLPLPGSHIYIVPNLDFTLASSSLNLPSNSTVGM